MGRGASFTADEAFRLWCVAKVAEARVLSAGPELVATGAGTANTGQPLNAAATPCAASEFIPFHNGTN